MQQSKTSLLDKQAERYNIKKNRICLQIKIKKGQS